MQFPESAINLTFFYERRGGGDLDSNEQPSFVEITINVLVIDSGINSSSAGCDKGSLRSQTSTKGRQIPTKLSSPKEVD
jgi:hypothetical protein